MTTDHPLDETRIRELRDWLYDKAHFYGKDKDDQTSNRKIRRYRDILKWVSQLEEARSAASFNSGEYQQIAAWFAVCSTLDEWVPSWTGLADTGVEAACAAIPYAIQGAWQAGLDEGRDQVRGNKHAEARPVAWRYLIQGTWIYTETPQREVEKEHGFDPAQPLYAHQPPSAPVGVEWPLYLLRAGHWREVHTGRRCMRLEVTYDYATWERLMAKVESAIAQQPAAPGACSCQDFADRVVEQPTLGGRFSPDAEDGTWNITGCCGDSMCYVVVGMRYCPYCGKHLK